MSEPVSQRAESPLLKAIGFISTLCGIAAATMIFISVLITCQMIWMRFVMNASTIWQTEMVVYLMIAATMIGLPYVQRLRGHVNVDLLPMLLPPPLRRALALFTLALTIAVAAVIAFYGFELFHIAFQRNWKSDTVWGVSLWIPYLAIPLGFGLFVLQLAADLFAVVIGRENG
ncbi:TRAP transporter small permease [Pelagibius litoralis]|uniref:TRAP transporter small permease protein n=1 Tax=Pelagibius litoralis TaxID=374515 RepID=A0A967C7L1_9PROT|nr:TRAP transporter small permease [Pelagibius litoralis]NIA69101.1 TRAP transporter small permease [Pelagibius litoralis]